MADVVGVRFKRAGKIYYFDPAGIDLSVGDCVVVETARGLELGRVVIAPKQVLASELTGPLKSVVRKAEEKDAERARELEDRGKEALAVCGELIARLNLPMKLLVAEYSLGGDRLTFFFSAAERVDFRELVRQLTSRFRIRVELRQVGSRDETKLIGGCGRCGRPLCCATFLNEFAPVSIRMAKEQGLPLNPTKISGGCGRLLCCLLYENELYQAMKKLLPKEGQQVSTPMGVATVIGTNPLKETVTVELESEAAVELAVGEVVAVEGQPARKQRMNQRGNQRRNQRRSSKL